MGSFSKCYQFPTPVKLLQLLRFALNWIFFWCYSLLRKVLLNCCLGSVFTMANAANHVALNSKPEYFPPPYPLYMLCYNEATSVNCSEGWWLHRDDYYTLGSLCTRLFFYCCYYFPSSLFSCYQTCSWTSVQHKGSLKMLWTGFCSIIFVSFVCFGLLSTLELVYL